MDQVKPFGEPGGVEQGLIHAHGVHVAQPRLRLPGALVHGVADIGVQVADRFPGHAGPPEGVARQVDVGRIAIDFAVDFEVGVGLAILPPQGVFAQHPVLGIEVLLPYRSWLHHVGIAVKDRRVLLSGHHAAPIYCAFRLIPGMSCKSRSSPEALPLTPTLSHQGRGSKSPLRGEGFILGSPPPAVGEG